MKTVHSSDVVPESIRSTWKFAGDQVLPDIKDGELPLDWLRRVCPQASQIESDHVLSLAILGGAVLGIIQYVDAAEVCEMSAKGRSIALACAHAREYLFDFAKRVGDGFWDYPIADIWREVVVMHLNHMDKRPGMAVLYDHWATAIAYCIRQYERINSVQTEDLII